MMLVTLNYVCHWAGSSLCELCIIHLLWSTENVWWEAYHENYVKQIFYLCWTENSLRTRVGKDHTKGLKGHELFCKTIASSGNRLVVQYWWLWNEIVNKEKAEGDRVKKWGPRIQKTNTTELWGEKMGTEHWGGDTSWKIASLGKETKAQIVTKDETWEEGKVILKTTVQKTKGHAAGKRMGNIRLQEWGDKERHEGQVQMT